MKNVKIEAKDEIRDAVAIAGMLATELSVRDLDLNNLVELRREAQSLVAILSNIEAKAVLS